MKKSSPAVCQPFPTVMIILDDGSTWLPTRVHQTAEKLFRFEVDVVVPAHAFKWYEVVVGERRTSYPLYTTLSSGDTVVFMVSV